MKEEKAVRTTLYLPPDLWKECRLLAVKLDTTATDIVLRALEAYIPALKAGTAAEAAKAAKWIAKRDAAHDLAVKVGEQMIESGKSLHGEKGGRS